MRRGRGKGSGEMNVRGAGRAWTPGRAHTHTQQAYTHTLAAHALSRRAAGRTGARLQPHTHSLEDVVVAVDVRHGLLELECLIAQCDLRTVCRVLRAWSCVRAECVRASPPCTLGHACGGALLVRTHTHAMNKQQSCKRRAGVCCSHHEVEESVNGVAACGDWAAQQGVAGTGTAWVCASRGR
jgi:hypothetical protein